VNFESWTLPYGPATHVGVALLAPSQVKDLRKMQWHRTLTLSLLSSQVSILVRSHTVSATAGYTSTRFCIRCKDSSGTASEGGHRSSADFAARIQGKRLQGGVRSPQQLETRPVGTARALQPVDLTRYVTRSDI
jgi:hypothetical protein